MGVLTGEQDTVRILKFTPAKEEGHGLPLTGCVAAGTIHEAIEQSERIYISNRFNQKNQFLIEVSTIR